MKPGVLLSLWVIFLFSCLFSPARAANKSAASCSLMDVQTAINLSESGDVVFVPAGTCTWNNTLTITKGISLQGADAENTLIEGGITPLQPGNTYNEGNFLIVYRADTSSYANEPFRLTGFTFDMKNRSSGIMLNGNNIAVPVRSVRIDHNIIKQATMSGGSARGIIISGIVYGVIDHNNFSFADIGSYGNNQESWGNLVFAYGSEDNIYYEDNFFIDDSFHSCGQGGRYVSRYNDYTYIGTNGLFPWYDAHGNQPGGIYATMGVEIYGNRLNATSISPGNEVMAFAHRGGKALFFNNQITGPTTIPYSIAREEFNDSISPTTNIQPQHVSDSYYWNNRKGAAHFNVRISNYDNMEYNLTENVDFFAYNASFNGTYGVGCGTLTSRPATCTLGVGYWATDQSCLTLETANVGVHPSSPISGTLYKCTAPNIWNAYYTPYTYPHPLITDCTNYPTLCDSDEPICGNGVTEAGEACDGQDLNGYNCSTIAAGFKSGSLSCKPDCSSYDVSDCVRGNTIRAASCEQEDVQAAINNATNGDIVVVPKGICTWNTKITVIKGILLRGQGKGRTVIKNGLNPLDERWKWSNVLISYSPVVYNANKPFRITQFEFDGNFLGGGVNIANTATTLSGTITNIRIDHNYFHDSLYSGGISQRCIMWGGFAYGLVDNNEFENCAKSIDIEGGDQASWDNLPLELGSSNYVFVENNSFYNTNSLTGGITSGGQGGRYVWRNNRVLGTYDCQTLDVHGNLGSYPGGNRGTVATEVYNNNITLATGSNCGWNQFIDVRGGTNIIFNNTLTSKFSVSSGNVNFQLREEHCGSDGTCSGGWPDSSIYPCYQQIKDTYTWDNFMNGELFVPVVEPGSSSCVQLNRDYFNYPMPNYVPYTYPHPLALISLSSETHSSDTDGNDCVSTDEMIAFVDRWKLSTVDVSMPELMESIGLWKGGTGC
jgi:hypothetical protein